MEVCVIIAAAGRGERYGESDKLAQDLGGRAVLLRTVEAFARRDEVRSLLVAAPPERLDEYREKYGPTLGFHGATIVEGGRADRWESVRNALAHVPETATHVAVHDAARPAVTDRLLDRLFEAAANAPAVVPGVPVDCTVKRVSDEPHDLASGDEDAAVASILGDTGRVSIPARRVEATIDRAGLVLVQTPQIFETALLKRAYEQPDLAGLTDDASVVERLGETVYLIEGDPTNVKLTTPGDLELIRSILGLEPPAERPVHKRF